MNFDDPQVKFDAGQFAFYQRAIAARFASSALQLGTFHAVLMEDTLGLYAFSRDLGESHAYVFVNRRDTERSVGIKLDGESAASLVNWLDPVGANLVKPRENDFSAGWR